MACIDCGRPTKEGRHVCDDCWKLYEFKQALEERFYQKPMTEPEKFNILAAAVKRLLLVAFAGAFLSSCVHYMPAAVSTSSLGPKEEPLSMGTGRADSFYVLGFGPFGDASLEAAVKSALIYKKAHTMANVFVDRRVLNFPFDFLPLYSQTTTTVYGTLVNYPALPDQQEPPAQTVPKATVGAPEGPL